MKHLCNDHAQNQHQKAHRHDDSEARPGFSPGRILTIRSHSGLSGDMLLAGLALMNAAVDLEQAKEAPPVGISRLAAAANELLTGLVSGLCTSVPALAGAVALKRKEVNGIGGWQAVVDLPHEHVHRTLSDILSLIESSQLAEKAKNLARDCFLLLARCEAEVHGLAPEQVTFHEVGALDSILDIALACALFERLAPVRLVAAPLPLADGDIHCAHGQLPAPAPAVLALLNGICVRPFAGDIGAGELVTPTALALLRTFGCSFGPWPAFCVSGTALVYGSRVFQGAANGAVFAVGLAE